MMKNKIIKSTIIIADMPNKNNRIYPRSVLEKIVNDFDNESDNLGQLGTPDDWNSTHIEEASHVVKNLRIEGNKLVADIQIMDTPAGKRLSNLIEGKDFRPRGTGSLETKNGVHVIQDDYKLISIDALSSEKAFWKIDRDKKTETMLEDYEVLSDPSDSPETHRTKFAAFCKKHFEPADEKEIALRQRYLKAGFLCTSHGWPSSDIELLESKEVQDILAKVDGWNRPITRREFLHSMSDSFSHLRNRLK
jgi:hypothetical protein